MANEIVKAVAKKANLSEPIAQIAVDTVLNLLKKKLPEGMGSTLDSFLSSGNSSSSKSSGGGLGDIVGSLGNLLGKK